MDFDNTTNISIILNNSSSKYGEEEFGASSTSIVIILPPIRSSDDPDNPNALYDEAGLAILAENGEYILVDT